METLQNGSVDLTKAPRITIDKVIVLPGRGRKDFSKLGELYNSIKKLGVISPIRVDKAPDWETTGKVVLIAGECRLRCVTQGILTGEMTDNTIPYMWSGEALDDLTRKEIELDENLHRNELTWAESSFLMKQQHEIKTQKYGRADRAGGGWSLEKTAATAGVTTAHASQQIKMAKLLESRPDLAARLTALPMAAAAKEATRIETAERAERLHKSGELTLTSDFLHGDALQLIKSVPDGSIDLWLTDMPFGNETIEEREGEKGTTTESYLARLKPTDNMNVEDCCNLMSRLIPEVYRVLKPGAHFYLFFGFDLYERLIVFLRAAGFELTPDPLIWNKMRAMSPARGYEYSPCYEPILYGRKPPRDVRRLNDSAKKILDFKPLSVNEKIHPFQKPQELLDFLIKQSTQMGEKVLDTFAASGATVKAAKNCGRSALGFEIDQETFYKGQAWLVTSGK